MAQTKTIVQGRQLVVRTYSNTGPMGRKLQRALEIQSRMQLLEAQLKEMRSEFLAHMQDQNLDRMECGDIRVTRKVRHNWQYTPETAREMLQVQQMQRWEQSTGAAIDRPVIYTAISTVLS